MGTCYAYPSGRVYGSVRNIGSSIMNIERGCRLQVIMQMRPTLCSMSGFCVAIINGVSVFMSNAYAAIVYVAITIFLLLFP